MTTSQQNAYAGAVSRYIAYGKRYGFFWAEAALVEFLPANKPGGMVSDVPLDRLPGLVEALQNPPPNLGLGIMAGAKASLLACIAVAGLFLAAPAIADSTGPIQLEQDGMLWPEPTAEMKARLPERCKLFKDIIVPDPRTTPHPEWSAWRKSPDGQCHAWYKSPEARPSRIQPGETATSSETDETATTTSTGPIQLEQDGRLWPAPTAEQIAGLPVKCKNYKDIHQPNPDGQTPADRRIWRHSDDGRCYSWYNANILRIQKIDDTTTAAQKWPIPTLEELDLLPDSGCVSPELIDPATTDAEKRACLNWYISKGYKASQQFPKAKQFLKAVEPSKITGEIKKAIQ